MMMLIEYATPIAPAKGYQELTADKPPQLCRYCDEAGDTVTYESAHEVHLVSTDYATPEWARPERLYLPVEYRTNVKALGYADVQIVENGGPMPGYEIKSLYDIDGNFLTAPATIVRISDKNPDLSKLPDKSDLNKSDLKLNLDA